MIGYSALAGGDKVAYPENFDKGTLYAVVDRHDIKQYRELYATPAAVEAVRKGQPVPSGTVLTLVQYKAQVDAAGNPTKDANGRFQKGDLVAYAVMEKRDGWGTEYKDDIRNGEWEYQAFGPDKKVNDKANLTACFQCHKPHAGLDFVISLASLKGTPDGAMAKPAAGPGIVAIADFKFGPETVVVNQGPDDHLAQCGLIAASGHDHRSEGAALLDRAEGPEDAADARRRRHLRLHLRPAPGDEGQDRGQGIGTAASIDRTPRRKRRGFRIRLVSRNRSCAGA